MGRNDFTTAFTKGQSFKTTGFIFCDLICLTPACVQVCGLIFTRPSGRPCAFIYCIYTSY